ncbi:MAG: SDR family NAD(P)-dependent oxidoreductase [Kiritimatiellia bacterium]|jgi:3-oxoacyl-[acyl-carrier protein] reductase|nr:SDR family NAD(P)-dependent oxidoreductase [Kiritimatiellia bacterium]
MQLDLTAKTAIVTGAGRGIGRAISMMLASAGAHVILTARTEEQLESAVDEITSAGGSAEAFPADLADEPGILSLFQAVSANHSQLDILVNNAGYGVFGPLADFKTEDFDTVIDVNLRGAFICCREAMKLMIPNRSGYIINVSSVVGFKGYPNQAAYTAAKHGIMGITKSLAAEAQEHNIRASVISPGGVSTELIHNARPDLDPNELMQPEDIAQAVEYLLSLSDRAAIDEIYIRRKNSQPF